MRFSEPISEATGKEVPAEEIVRGFEVERDNFVVISDDELKRASTENSAAIEIQEFVNGSQIPTCLILAVTHLAALARYACSFWRKVTYGSSRSIPITLPSPSSLSQTSVPELPVTRVMA